MPDTSQYIVIGEIRGERFMHQDFYGYTDALELVDTGDAVDVIDVSFDVETGLFETGRSVFNLMERANEEGRADAICEQSDSTYRTYAPGVA